MLFENKVLRKVFGAKRDEVTGEWRKLHNAELHTLYSSPYIIKPYSAKGLGDRLYVTLHKLPGEVGYSFCLILKS